MAALESIRNQTYINWELFCFDDLSTDSSWKILKTYTKKDKRIKVFRNGSHKGVSGAANAVLGKAKGAYIARMDADDISLPRRFEKQVAYLEKHSNVIAVGSQCDVINSDGEIIGHKNFPTKSGEVYQMMFVSIPVQQPCLMINRRKLPNDFVWYRQSQHTAEEVDLLFRLLQIAEVANLPQTLLQYRIHGKNTSLKNPKKTFIVTLLTRIKSVFDYGYRPSIKGVFMTLIQTMLVLILPSRLIYPVYNMYRGIHQVRSNVVRHLSAKLVKV